MTFKDRLRGEIEYKGLLVKEMSAALGISNSTFLSYIDARGALPNVENAVKIAKYLGVTVEYLVTGEDSRPTPDSKYSNIKEITKDLASLDEAQLAVLKRMIHALVD